jgi:hypothetical protein
MKKTVAKSKVDPVDMSEIKSFEDACRVRGIDLETCLPDVKSSPAHHQQALIATAKMYIIAEALNQDPETKECWRPDWNNWDQYKYIPWFDLEVDKDNPSGFRFHGSLTVSLVRSRPAALGFATGPETFPIMQGSNF